MDQKLNLQGSQMHTSQHNRHETLRKSKFLIKGALKVDGMIQQH